MAMRGSWAVVVLAPLLLLVDGPARADGPSSPVRGLRPAIHVDRRGNTLVDVCPERTVGGRRCFAQRIVRPDAPIPLRPFSGGGGQCTAMGGGGGSGPPPGTMAPKDVIARYNLPASAHANGAIVALVELPSVYALTDVNSYRAAYGIPALAACPTNGGGYPTPAGTACFARVGEDGSVNSVSSTDCPGWSGETGLDMAMVSAACPDCSIVLVEANGEEDLPAMNAVAASSLGAAAVSNSWGAPEFMGIESDESAYSSTNILTLAASGDEGYLNEDEGAGAPNYPASSPHVLSVGGTTLEVLGAGTYNEVVWDDDGTLGGGGAGGSGCSGVFATPTWQSGSGFSFGPCTMRASVDVSAAAEFYPEGEGGGIAAYDQDDGGWNSVVGTSAASPMMAAIMVRLGLAGKDNHQLLYSNINAFNDVISGNNDARGMCGGTVMCTAGKGYDGPSGLGTPNGVALLAITGATPPPDGGTPVGDGSTPVGEGGTNPDGGSPPGSIGTPCTGPNQCTMPNICVASKTGKSVCAPACDPGVCPTNYECTLGYCFADPPKKDTGSSSDGSGGCSCTEGAASSPWAGAGWLTLGLLALTTRRRRSSTPGR
jgi:MYXO-CTERM domain-containing protein